MENKPLVPKLRFPEFGKAKEWHVRSLGDLLAERQESGFTDLPLLSVTAKEGVIPQEQTNRRDSSNIDRSKYLRVVPGDIAYNTMRMWEGRSALVGLEGVVSPAYTVCKPKAESNSQFFSFYFKTPQLIENFRKLSQGLVKDTLNLKYDAFSKISALVPSPAEQQKIAECLASLDELITAEGRKLKALRTYKKGLMQNLFPCEGETVPRLRFPEFRDAGGWALRELGPSTIKVGSGITPLGGDKNYKRNGRPFVRSQNVGWGELLLDELAHIDDDTHRTFRATEIKEGDVLLNITGASIGRSAIADARIVGGNVNQHVCIIRVKADELHSVLLNQFLISDRGQKQIDSFQAGGNRQGLNFAQIRSFEIPTPPTEAEQCRIADCLTSLDDRVTAQAKKLDTLKRHKQGLMQGLFPAIEERP